MSQATTKTRAPHDPTPPPAKVRRAKTRHLTAGHLVPVVLAVTAGVVVLVVLQQRNATVSIAVVRGPIAAGSVIDSSNTRLVKVRASDVALTHGLIGADQLGQSWVASVDLNNGEPIARSEIARSGSNTGLGAMSIDVPADHAAGGSIVAGDRVDVIAADGSGGASYIAQGLRVLTVAPSGDGGLLGATVGDYWVEVAVDKATALRLTAAMGGTDSLTGIEVVRSDGEVNSPTERYSSKYGRPQGITQPATASTTTPPSR